MSAYIVNGEVISKILDHIKQESQNNPFFAPYRWLKDFGVDLRDPRQDTYFFNRLYGMNFRAVWQRYGDHMGWTFDEIQRADFDRKLDYIEVSDALREFTYQCAEGTVYTEPLYELMDKISNYYRPLAKDLQAELDQIAYHKRAEHFSSVRKLQKKEVAKLIKSRLKSAYPGVKFSVTSSQSYSSVDVNWVDGPTVEQVKQLVGMFKGGSYNYEYMEKVYTVDPETQEEIYCCNDYLCFDRDYSKETLITAWQQFCDKYTNVPLTDIEFYQSYDGSWNYSFVNGDILICDNGSYPYDTVQTQFNEYISSLACTLFSEYSDKKTSDPQNTDSGVQFGEYKGHATITLPNEAKGFSFGVKKAQLILEYLTEIKQFVEDNKGA